MARDTFSIQMWYFASQSRIKIPWFLLFIISKARQLLFKEANGQFDVCAWWCVVWVCVRACVCLQSGRWVSYLQCSHTHPLLCLINTVLNSSLHTRPRTQTHMHGQTQLCNIFLHDAEGILNMSNFTLTLLSAYAVPPPTTHTHTRVGECVFICAFLCGCAICACVHNGPEIINSSSWCPPGEQNIKLERETCARVFVCACKRGSREDSEQQLDRFEFTQDGEKMSGDKQKKTIRNKK